MQKNRDETVSNGERRVLERLEVDKIIAFDLKIKPGTIDAYKANLMTKMGVSCLSIVKVSGRFIVYGVLMDAQDSSST